MGLSQYIGASAYTKPGVIDNTAARPASPYEGQVIFQKDTDQLLVWNGTAWVVISTPTILIDAPSGTISSQGVGNFKTIASNGRGVGIAGGTGDTASILQFTNNAVSSQWGSIVATSPSNLAINANSITTSTPITGSVVQIKHDIFATNYSRTNTTGTPIDVTGWSMSITPAKAGNKIIIFTQAALMAICDGYLYLKKNGSFLANPLISVPRVDFANDDATFFGQYVDTAPSTSAITYQFSAVASGCSGFFGVNSQGGISSTILIEVQS